LRSSTTEGEEPYDYLKNQNRDVLEISESEPSGLTGLCPIVAVDAIGWVGYAKLTYGTNTGSDIVEMAYFNPDDKDLATESVNLEGYAFPGYEVTAVTDPENPTVTEAFAYVTLHVDYDDVVDGEATVLDGALASSVSIVQLFIPEPGPTLEGCFPPCSDDTILTSSDGHVTFYFALEPGTWAWTVTPQGGEPANPFTLTIPDPF
jgi:hypothetical protein